MMYDDFGSGSGWGWALMLFMPLLWIGLIVVLVWAIAHTASTRLGDGSRGAGQAPAREAPEEILDRRYAEGEIDGEAYSEARERLAAHRSQSS